MSVNKIMVCDDDSSIVDMVEMVLEFSGLEVCSETDSFKMFNRVVEEKPDLLIIDIWMPGLSGDQIIKRLRNEEATKNLPIIALSASRDGKEISLGAGATEFISKPFDIDALVNRTMALLN